MSSIALEVNLIDELLAEQQRLTPVERFAQRHERAALPAQARYYSDLIPSSKPGLGQQYAFAVDLDVCTGCKACVSACHSLNGLEEHETWRDVGLITGTETDKPYLQTVTTACHHCLEPACLEGCPVLAYDKNPETGIVRHLDDQCIGCQYCTMKCPYDVPKYSSRLGIVRKCDMCTDRLAAGEAPACVQACPHEAIAIRLVDVAEVSAAALPGAQLISGAFDSSYTKPTTQYVSKKRIPRNAEPADAHALRLEHAHWPLIIMLLLSQMAAGIYLTIAAMGALPGGSLQLYAAPVATLGFLALNAGLAAATLHLGRPLGAWRFFLGLRTSWMSREILAFGLFAGAAFAATLFFWVLPRSPLALAGLVGASAMGLLAVFTSVMIYADTRRAFWSLPLTAVRFYGTTILLGATAAATAMSWIGVFFATDLASELRIAMIPLIGVQTLLFAWEFWSNSQALRDPSNPCHRSLRTIRVLLPWLMSARVVLFVVAIFCSLVAIAASGPISAIGVSVALAATFASQIFERFSFFTAVTAPRMPGGI
ncbi:MAG TPA: DmsC/YnfH family molybdoenzyme membrane anchor subunit [Terrimicrobiaceae bacterium]